MNWGMTPALYQDKAAIMTFPLAYTQIVCGLLLQRINHTMNFSATVGTITLTGFHAINNGNAAASVYGRIYYVAIGS